MSKTSTVPPASDNFDFGSLGTALWRAKAWIAGLALGAGVVTYIGLSMMRPIYTSEVQKVAKSIEHEPKVPAVHETSVGASLNTAKTKSAGLSDTEARLRALEREARANRELLESYLGRNRDASARHNPGEAPAPTAIVSRTDVVIHPSFPNHGSLSLLIMLATAFLALTAIVARTRLRSGQARAYEEKAQEPKSLEMSSSKMKGSDTETCEQELSNTEPVPAKPQEPKTPKPKPSELVRSEARVKAKALLSGTAQKTEASAGATSVWRAKKPAKRPSWLQANEPRRKTSQTGAKELVKKAAGADTQPETVTNEDASMHERAPATSAPIDKTIELGSTKPAVLEGKAKEPAVTSANKNASEQARPEASSCPLAARGASAATGAITDRETEQGNEAKDDEAASSTHATADNKTRAIAKAPSETAPQHEDEAGKDDQGFQHAPVAQSDMAMGKQSPLNDAEPQAAARNSSAADFIKRLRKDVKRSGSTKQTSIAIAEPTKKTGLLDRFRYRHSKRGSDTSRLMPLMTRKQEPSDKANSKEVEMAALSPNDLRHYLTQRIAGSTADDDIEILAKPKVGMGTVGPVFHSLDMILEDILEGATGGLPRTMLVAGTSAQADATLAAIDMARTLADSNEQVALVDLAKGGSTVSGELGMPRVPGFSDLTAGQADFVDVVRIDDDSALQVIAAGKPMQSDGSYEPDRFMQVFEALTQVYDCVVLHADLAAMDALMPALKFELPVAVAVLPANGTIETEGQALWTFQRLGCPIVVYESTLKQRRTGLFSRQVAVQ